MHVVSTNLGQRLLSVTASGFLVADEVAAAARDVHAAIARMGGDAKDHVTLYDLTAVDVQSADVVALFRDFMANPAYQGLLGRKIAFVSGSALLTMQLKRVQQDLPGIALFSDRTAAINYLLAA